MSATTNIRGSPVNGEQRVTLLLGIKFYVWLDGFTATTTKVQSLHSKPVVGKYDSFLAIRTWESRMFENGVYLDIITAELLELASTRVIDRHRIDPIPTLNSHSFGDMAFFFRTKKQDVVKPTKELLTRLWQPPKSQKVRCS